MTLDKQAIRRGVKAAGVLAMKGLNMGLVVSGIACVGYGAWLVYQPAAYVVVGCALVWLGLPEKVSHEPR